MLRTISHLFAAALAAPLFLVATTASAAPDRSACGNIELVATGECHLEVEGGCVAKCEPPNFVAACNGKCEASANVQCTSSCNTSCEADCNVNPGGFDCEGSCQVDCQGSCDASCSARPDKAECKAYCQSSCKTDCQARCEAVPPMADCKAQCQGCCSGSCEAQANFNCSFDCSAELKGGCEVDCKKPEGALFCDGQYVQVGNLEDCIAYLESQFELNIEFEAHAEASASASCTTSPVGRAPFDVGAITAAAVGVGFVVSRRRRRG